MKVKEAVKPEFAKPIPKVEKAPVVVEKVVTVDEGKRSPDGTGTV